MKTSYRPPILKPDRVSEWFRSRRAEPAQECHPPERESAAGRLPQPRFLFALCSPTAKSHRAFPDEQQIEQICRDAMEFAGGDASFERNRTGEYRHNRL